MRSRGVIMGTRSLTVIFVFMIAASAQAQEPTPNYGSAVWARPALPGDWGGLRTQLAEKGVTFEVDFGSIVQGVVDGGHDTTTRWSGWNQMVLKLDSQKLGLWP